MNDERTEAAQVEPLWSEEQSLNLIISLQHVVERNGEPVAMLLPIDVLGICRGITNKYEAALAGRDDELASQATAMTSRLQQIVDLEDEVKRLKRDQR
jgi:hypothetical protein